LKGGLLLSITNIFDLDMNQQRQTDDYYVFFVNQTDYQSRTVQANLYITYAINKDTHPYNLTDEMVNIIYEYINSNGNKILTEEFSCTKATSIGNNVITFVIPNEVVLNCGKVNAQIKIYKEIEVILNSTLFLFYVNDAI
jgi:hypothetical protein